MSGLAQLALVMVVLVLVGVTLLARARQRVRDEAADLVDAAELAAWSAAMRLAPAKSSGRPHPCGLCDEDALVPDSVSFGYQTWRCASCGWWHTSIDCCHAA